MAIMGFDPRLSRRGCHSGCMMATMRTIRIALTFVYLGGCGGGGGGGSPDAGPPGPDAGAAATALFVPPTPGQAAAWATVPFPSDLYLDASGHLALASLPAGPGADPAEAQKLTESLATLDGAGVESNVYFPVAGELDPATLAGQVKLVDL